MPSARRTILIGGILIGSLDALDALVFFGLRGVRLPSIFQYIAIPALGRQSLKMGLPSTLLGVVLHYCVAFAIAAVFYAMIRTAPGLLRTWVATGLIFGVTAWFVMNMAVLPLAGIPFSWPAAPVLCNGLAIHALLGLVLSWVSLTPTH